MWRFSCALCVAAVVAAGAAGPAWAGTLCDVNGRTVDIEYWAGSGGNKAVTVVDFGPGAAYAFGYRWSDGDTFTRPTGSYFTSQSPTGSAALSEAMLLALNGSASAGRLEVAYTYHNAWGFQVGSFTYAGRTLANDWIATFAAYYISGSPAWSEDLWAEQPPGSGHWVQTGTVEHPAVPGDGVNWVFSGFGVSMRVLSDGFYDGWAVGDASTWSSPPPATPTPEPASLALVGLGALLVLRRRRR